MVKTKNENKEDGSIPSISLKILALMLEKEDLIIVVHKRGEEVTRKSIRTSIIRSSAPQILFETP